MDEALRFFVEHPYAVMFAFVLVDQFGLPLPVLPVVVAVGGLAGDGQLDPGLALAVVVGAALPGDWAWYELGRAQGVRVLRTLCRISLEPDSCVRNTQGVFARHGPRSLLVAKWVPGLQTAAPPLAGAAHMGRAPFLIYSIGGTVFWAGTVLAVGYLLHAQLEHAADLLARLGGVASAGVLALLGVYLAAKWLRRRRVLRELRVARISPLELHARLDSGASLSVIDLRHPVDYAADPVAIPGARRITPEALEDPDLELPRDAEVVLYCT